MAHDRSEGAAPTASAAPDTCFRKLRLEFIVPRRLLSPMHSNVHTAGPEKESGHNRAGGISEGKVPSKRNLEDVNRVELQAREPRFRRPQRTSDQGGEAQLYPRVELDRRM